MFTLVLVLHLNINHSLHSQLLTIVVFSFTWDSYIGDAFHFDFVCGFTNDAPISSSICRSTLFSFTDTTQGLHQRSVKFWILDSAYYLVTQHLIQLSSKVTVFREMAKFSHICNRFSYSWGNRFSSQCNSI